MTGDDLRMAASPARALGMFCPPRVQDDADQLARMIGEKVGALAIPPRAVYAFSQTVAIMVMFPEAPGKTGAEILADSRRQWASREVRGLAESYAAKYSVNETERGLALLKRVMDPILTEIGDRNVPEDANWQLVAAVSFVIATDLAT